MTLAPLYRNRQDAGEAGKIMARALERWIGKEIRIVWTKEACIDDNLNKRLHAATLVEADETGILIEDKDHWQLFAPFPTIARVFLATDEDRRMGQSVADQRERDRIRERENVGTLAKTKAALAAQERSKD